MGAIFPSIDTFVTPEGLCWDEFWVGISVSLIKLIEHIEVTVKTLQS